MNNKRNFFDLYKDIALVTRVRIFFMPLFSVYQKQHKSRDSI